MNKGQLIGGGICLGLAILLAVLNFTLPPENLMFQVGNQNMPWVPPVVLAIVGGWLLFSIRRNAISYTPTSRTKL